MPTTQWVHPKGYSTSPPSLRDRTLAKPNYSFEKRQREIAKKKQQDEKQAKKKAAREGAKTADPQRDPPTGHQ